MNLRRLAALSAVVVIAASAPAGPAGAAIAQATPAATMGIRIVDAPANRSDDPRARQYIVDHVAGGTTLVRRVEVSNDTEQTQTVQLYAAAAAIDNGDFQFGDGRETNELTGWTTVDSPSLSTPAGGTAQATVTIAVPVDATAGERYAVVWAELPGSTPPDGGITTVNRVGVRIYLSVGSGAEPASDFTIPTFEARRGTDGSPVVAATVHNTGGRALDLSGDLLLTNGPGGLTAGPFAVELGTTLGIGGTEPVLVVLDPAIPPGPWDARMVLRSGTTQREATATITFPTAPATAEAPVPTYTPPGSRNRSLLAVGGSAFVALDVCILGWFLRRRRRRTLATT